MLDEFALSLYLKDVYWTREGRKSIDAVMVAIVMALALLLGTSRESASTLLADEAFDSPTGAQAAIFLARAIRTRRWQARTPRS